VGCRVRDLDLYRRALTHSTALGSARRTDSYERLEYLGDAVAELVTRSALMERLPLADEVRRGGGGDERLVEWAPVHAVLHAQAALRGAACTRCCTRRGRTHRPPRPQPRPRPAPRQRRTAAPAPKPQPQPQP
jgi:hypothetical protein